MPDGYTNFPKHINVQRVPAPCWRVIEVRYFDSNLHQGNESCNIYVRAKNADGQPAYTLAIMQDWTGNDERPPIKQLGTMNRHEIEGDPNEGIDFAACDFVMSKDSVRPSHDEPGPYNVQVVGTPYKSDVVSGFGLDREPYRGHDAYRVEFQLVLVDEQPPQPPVPPDTSELDKAILASEQVTTYLKSLK